MKSRIWGVLVGVLISLSVVSAQSGGWVWQNNGSTLTTSTPNAASAVTIWNKNNSGCTLTLKTASAGTVALSVCGTTITVPTGTALTGLDSITFSGGQSLVGSTADVTELRRGVNAQAFRLYNTFTDASNYERLNIRWTANEAFIETGSAGTGGARSLWVGALGAGATMNLMTAGFTRWIVSATGHLTAGSDNAYDIGTSGANRPRTGYFGTSVVSPIIYGGGTTSSYPMLQRSGAGWRLRLADDSTWAALAAAGADFAGNVRVGVSGTAGQLFINDVSRIKSSTANQYLLTDYSTDAIGAMLDTSVNSTLHIKTLAGADTATLKANKLLATGNAGIGGVTISPWSDGTVIEFGTAGSALWNTTTNTYITANYYYNGGDKFAGTGYAAYNSIIGADGSFRWYASSTSGTAGNAATIGEKMRLYPEGALSLTEIAYAARPGVPATGMMVNFSDSNTATWGATVAGGGANHVLARYNGTNWTVVGK